ncbi:MAG: hypothetical protein V1781_05855 [Bacteroidota bacterium]
MVVENLLFIIYYLLLIIDYLPACADGRQVVSKAELLINRKFVMAGLTRHLNQLSP